MLQRFYLFEKLRSSCEPSPSVPNPISLLRASDFFQVTVFNMGAGGRDHCSGHNVPGCRVAHSHPGPSSASCARVPTESQSNCIKLRGLCAKELQILHRTLTLLKVWNWVLECHLSLLLTLELHKFFFLGGGFCFSLCAYFFLCSPLWTNGF